MRQVAAMHPDPRVGDALRLIEWSITSAPWNTTEAYAQVRRCADGNPCSISRQGLTGPVGVVGW